MSIKLVKTHILAILFLILIQSPEFPMTNPSPISTFEKVPAADIFTVP